MVEMNGELKTENYEMYYFYRGLCRTVIIDRL
jgi:hypothetical protein